MAAEKTKTKFEKMMDATKGFLEYNPKQTFALHVQWVVRSPTAAREMIQKGFVPCARATMRDTPTTLAYVFRISRDQRPAELFKESVKTIGQHPHYAPVLKNIDMGVPRAGLEMRLKQTGINPAPLDWGAQEPISGHQSEIDFDPVVLECTEIYLDNRAFYEHGASREWMKYSAEILKPCRSLKPKTYSLGNPDEKIWDTVLEPSLKAVRFGPDSGLLRPGVFTSFDSSSESKSQEVAFLELDISVLKANVESARKALDDVQKELNATWMIVIPTNFQSEEQESFDLRVMFTFIVEETRASSQLGELHSKCSLFGGRIIILNSSMESADATQDVSLARANLLLETSGVPEKLISVFSGHELAKAGDLAGYPVHPLIKTLEKDDNLNYQP
jgi:hypothetical protein